MFASISAERTDRSVLGLSLARATGSVAGVMPGTGIARAADFMAAAFAFAYVSAGGLASVGTWAKTAVPIEKRAQTTNVRAERR